MGRPLVRTHQRMHEKTMPILVGEALRLPHVRTHKH